VTLLVVDSEERAGRHGEEPGADIALYLARHGARVEVEQVLSQGSRVADIILSFARDHGMDLIVIGAYSHARSVEMLFGGVTRTLLKLAPVPLLMSRRASYHLRAAPDKPFKLAGRWKIAMSALRRYC